MLPPEAALWFRGVVGAPGVARARWADGTALWVAWALDTGFG